MTLVRVTVRLPQPPETVFALLADPENDPRWCRAVASCTYDGGGPPGAVGARYTFREGFKPDKTIGGQVEITALDPPRRMVTVATTPRRRYTITYDLVAEGSGCRLRQTADARFAGAAGRFTVLAKPLIAMQYRRQFRDLAATLATAE